MSNESSFNATIEYGKLAITLVASLGASAGLALLAFVGTRTADDLQRLSLSPGDAKLAVYLFIAAAALPPATAALSYWSQAAFTDDCLRLAERLRWAAAVTWVIALLSFVSGSVRALDLVIR